MQSKVSIGLVCAACVFSSWMASVLHRQLIAGALHSGATVYSDASWFFDLLMNLTGYATVILPFAIVYKYLQRINYFEKLPTSSPISRFLFACFGPVSERLPESAGSGAGVAGAGGSAGGSRGAAREGAELLFCLTGLLGAYLVWGLLQEKIMTQKYAMSDGSYVIFTDSQFLVFTNRLSACVVSLAQLLLSGTALSGAPLYKYSYCSLTNVLSAWCQYEALKYVTFPTQVLSKSCKVLPVMAMGRFLSGNKYSVHEYVTAVLISLGMVLFLFGTNDHTVSVSVSVSASGAALLLLYMVCDSFTSSWQNQLFRTYHVSPIQMMFGVNLCSCLLTGVSLLQNPNTGDSVALLMHPVFLVDCSLLAASSAVGQLLIYRTIDRFGAVVFTIIMTLRQAVSILLSCLVFGHVVSWYGGAGVLLVFLAVLLRVYCRQKRPRRH